METEAPIAPSARTVPGIRSAIPFRARPQAGKLTVAPGTIKPVTTATVRFRLNDIGEN